MGIKGNHIVKLGSVFLAVSLVVSACSGSVTSDIRETSGEVKSEESTIQIGISFDTSILEHWKAEGNVFEDTVRQMGADIEIQTVDGDVEKQKEQIQTFTEENKDAIVIAAADCYALKDQVKEARNKGIQVISYDRLIQGEQTDLYITVDNMQAGTLMAKHIKEKLRDGGNIMMICGPESDADSRDVTAGFENEIEGGPWKIVYKSNVLSWNPENEMQAVTDAFAGMEEKIDAVMCGNDELAGYVIQSLDACQLAENIVVVGKGADLEACRRIVDGTQSMTVCRPIHDLAKTAAECTVKLVQGKQLMGDALNEEDVKKNEDGQEVPYLAVKPSIVTPETLGKVIIDSGIYSEDEVYLNTGNEQQVYKK